MRGRSKESALLNPDFRDLLSIFNEENVEYLLVGAYALAAYGNPRATKDRQAPGSGGCSLARIRVRKNLDQVSSVVAFHDA